MDLKSLIKYYVANAPQMMWFLGAGTSRSANMPTANDLVWDLKLKHYCLEQNVDIKSHDITNDFVKRKIQAYMDSMNYPEMWSQEEYSFYFELVFGDDYQLQQKYLMEKLNPDKISLNIGHRALVGLLGTGKAKIVFTTNFDEVIETAYAKIMGKNLPTYHLEGSYAVVEALNQEKFPIYAKIHGDFRYQKVKNLSADLLENDQKIQQALIASSSRYGLVVTGYSGRDANVMGMFSNAIEQNNAFPNGLYWTVLNKKEVLIEVEELIQKAKANGIKAEIIETGTFDTFLLALWKQISGIDPSIIKNVNANNSKVVNIPSTGKGKRFPMIRTNAIPIMEFPLSCAKISLKKVLSVEEFYKLIPSKKTNAVFAISDGIYAWGEEDEIKRVFEDFNEVKIEKFTFQDPSSHIMDNTHLLSFFERGLSYSLAEGKPFLIKRDRNNFVLVPKKSEVNNSIFSPVIAALSNNQFTAKLLTNISTEIYQIEAVQIKLEVKGKRFWLMLKPVIWIEPTKDKQVHIEQVKEILKHRYNTVANKLLDAWIKILFGDGHAIDMDLFAFKDSKYAVKFKLNTRTSFSRM